MNSQEFPRLELAGAGTISHLSNGIISLIAKLPGIPDPGTGRYSLLPPPKPAFFSKSLRLAWYDQHLLKKMHFHFAALVLIVAPSNV